MIAAKTVDQLDEAELEAFRHALAEHVGSEEAVKLAWVRRAARSTDGEWLLEVREPVLPREKLDPRPGLWPASYIGLQDRVNYRPIAQAVALLTGPENPEADLAQRFRWREESIAAAKAEREQRERERVEVIEAARRRIEERPLRWAALPQEQRLLLVVAARLRTGDAQGHGAYHAIMDLVRLMGRGPSALEAVPDTFDEFEGHRR